MNYFGLWYLVAAVAIWFIGFETKGRTIEQIDSALAASETPELASEAATR
jgi:hypothetical protein